MWSMLLDTMLSALVRRGQFRVSYPGGQTKSYGDGTGPLVHATIENADIVRQLAINPDLAIGEAYMNGDVTFADDDVYNFLALAALNMSNAHPVWWQRAVDRVRHHFRRIRQANKIGVARQNVAHHYDLSAELYDLFLDTDKQYSCAYFTDPDMTLENAQAAKKAHIAHKLVIEPGMTVLDIGCGWGGMGLTLARDFGARVVGVTLSEEQHKVATRRVRQAGLDGQVEFRLTDYRNVSETFDRVVSVGMFEHVGIPHYREYFRNVSNRLGPDGVALIHTIGRIDSPGFTSPWIDKYIFPGGYCPSLSEVASAVEDEHLYTCDVEVWRLHYAETLRHWNERFLANEDTAREIYDDRFCRMWRYYLAACETAFRFGRQAVFQVQLSHRQEAVPLTRDYLYQRDQQQELRHAAE